MPARSTYSGSQPASTRSSPSATKSSLRLRLRMSLRISLSFWLSGEVIMAWTQKRAPLAKRPGKKVWLRLGGSLPGALGKSAEGLGVADGDVGQHLAVEFDLGLAQAVHELRVAHPLAAGGRVDARDPEAPEVALLVAPVAVGVRVGLEQLLLRPLVTGVLVAAVALRARECRAAFLAGVD